MWGEASHVHLSRDNSILRAPGTCKGHHQMLPPLSHLSGCSQNFRASTQLRTGGNSASRRLKHMETCSPLRGYKAFVIFSRDFLENHSLNPPWVRGWSALHKQHITAHSKAAAPAGRWQNWSLGRWIQTNMSYFWVMNYCDPFPPKLASVLYCSHFSSYQSHPSRE